MVFVGWNHLTMPTEVCFSSQTMIESLVIKQGKTHEKNVSYHPISKLSNSAENERRAKRAD